MHVIHKTDQTLDTDNYDHFAILLDSCLVFHRPTDYRMSLLRVVYKSQQLAKFTAFSARFHRLLSLLHKSR